MVKAVSTQEPTGIDQLIVGALSCDGVFTTRDALQAGVSHAALTRAVTKGRILRVLPRTYLVAGADYTWWARARAATAWSGGAVSHLSAAFAHGMITEPPVTMDVVSTTVRRGPAGSGIRCHISPLMGPPHVLPIKGIPMTSPTRTLLDMASVVRAEVLEMALEEALRRGLTNMARLEWQLRTEGRRGRGGTASLRELLNLRGAEVAAAESPLETKVARWFRSTRLPVPMRQHRVLADGRFIARIDFAYPQAKVAIEAHSYRWHSGRGSWIRDEQRQRDLERLGWQVLYVTYEDITQRGSQLEVKIASALGLSLF